MYSNSNTLKTITETTKVTPVVFHEVYGVSQKDEYSCGAACYATIIKTLKKNISIEKAKKEVKTKKNGTWFRKIAKALKNNDLVFSQTFMYEPNIKKIEHEVYKNSICLVCLQAWEDSLKEMKRKEAAHYALVCGYTRKYFIMFDPWAKIANKKSTGYVLINKKDFQDRWGVETLNGENIEKLGLGRYYYLSVPLKQINL